jgi:hypothetical protein
MDKIWMFPISLKTLNNEVIRKMLVEVDGYGGEDGMRYKGTTHTVAG